MSTSKILGILHDTLLEDRQTANAIVDEVQKKRVNVGKVVHEFRKDEKTEDETIKAFQTFLEKANKIILEKTTEVDNYIKANLVAESAMSDDEYKAKEAEYKTLCENMRDALNMAKGRKEFKSEDFADLPALLSLKSGKEKSESAASGIKRPRLEEISINGEPCFVVKTDPKSKVTFKSYTFSHAATWITKDVKDPKVKVTATDLSSAAFETVGTDNLSDQTSIEFTFTVTDSKDVLHSYDVLAIPASTDDSTSDEVASEDDEEEPTAEELAEVEEEDTEVA
jgi:hypothetical protein